VAWQGIVFLVLMIGIPILVAWWVGGPPKEKTTQNGRGS
jgi:hypothetical protein